MKHSNHLTIVIVSHNSKDVIFRCLSALIHSEFEIIIVDSGSTDHAYLNEVAKYSDVKLIREKNIGFSAANNLGISHASNNTQYILFLNPDCFVTQSVINRLIASMGEPLWSKVGAVSPALLGFDVHSGRATGLVDSAGLGHTWFGRFYDVLRGKPAHVLEKSAYQVFGLCGAFILVRRSALNRISSDGIYWDPRFFMYKEDVEFSARLRHYGYQILVEPNCVAFHARGWDNNRKNVSTRSIVTSLRSDWILLFVGKFSFVYKILFFGYLTCKTVYVLIELLIRLKSHN